MIAGNNKVTPVGHTNMNQRQMISHLLANYKHLACKAGECEVTAAQEVSVEAGFHGTHEKVATLLRLTKQEVKVNGTLGASTVISSPT